MIVVTGAAGFIGSCLCASLNAIENKNLVLVDDFSKAAKARNLDDKSYIQKVERNKFIRWFEENHEKIDFVFHLGARTDTTESNWTVFLELNLDYSKAIWEICARQQIPLVYASSAATYGAGENGYSDSHENSKNLKPLNPYGQSKQAFDLWALEQDERPPFWVGLKFFNVYGPNEYHKGRMASVIFHTYHQVKETGEMKLFASNDERYENGQQLRDFIYVKDLCKVMLWFRDYSKKDAAHKASGLYNLGTGKARTFYALAYCTQTAMGLEPKISYKPMPEDLLETYQNFTEADMQKLLDIGYDQGFYSLEEGIQDYVTNYLSQDKYL